MAQSSGCVGLVGNYIIGKQIGSGSFSVVWHGRHRVHGTEVAIKEIATGRLNQKLQESLMSEIFILKKINHPNIIRLYDIIEVPGKIHLVLEYCRGGDLSMYIQRHRRVQEGTAKYFMQQLAAGLKVLRDNNLIHRDLKPQNLLLTRKDDNSDLKIADFGFARSLQPRGLAETLCGSPLYMAPEIMQLQKYDYKADLWSVGVILFQLVTGRTPFTGSNQMQLLQNIIKSTELQFPSDNQILSSECKDLCRKLLRRNPVERLTFEEYFNHPFLCQKQPEQDKSSRRGSSSRMVGGICLAEPNPLRRANENHQEDCLPFFLDDDSCPGGSPSFSRKTSSIKSTYGFDLNAQKDRAGSAFTTSNNMNLTPRKQPENSAIRLDSHRTSARNLTDPLESLEQRLANTSLRVADSLENIDQDYVLVSGPPMDVSSSSVSAPKPCPFPYRSGVSLQESSNVIDRISSPMPISGAATRSTYQIGSLESQDSGPGTSHASMDTADEQPSADCMTRIRSLQQCASGITKVVHKKVENRKLLEAFPVQLVILAIWKQALHICHAQAASAMEGSPSQERSRCRRSTNMKHGISDSEECLDGNVQGPKDILSQIGSEFLKELKFAEELAKDLEGVDRETTMPDAMETIFQSALAFGRRGAVEELMGELDNAVAVYSIAVQLLVFLIVEAPSLIVNPPFSLTNIDRYRLRSYINDINIRKDYVRSQLLLKRDEAEVIL
ncbi:hypothetical protein K1719_012961 [Acacia pycnantha]|nr:hypothetical protein K1719_012961 [Acacia pycnantha]